MFTGIVTAVGDGRCEFERTGGEPDAVSRIACPFDAAGIEIGASIACAGICLTVGPP